MVHHLKQQSKDKSNEHNPALVAGMCTLLGATVVHLPGLICQYRFDAEGLFLISELKFLMGGISDGLFFLFFVTNTVSISFRKGQQQIKKLAVRIVVVAAMLIFLLTSIGDEIWQEASQGAMPEMWVVIAGIKNARSHINAHSQSDGNGLRNRILKHVIAIVVGLVIHFIGCIYYYAKTNKHFITSECLLYSAISAFALNNVGCWLPVIQKIQFLALSFILSPPGLGVELVHSIKNANLKNAPNVIYIISDSMSGAYSLDTHKGRAAMPFFQSLIKNDTQLHVFPNVRSASGNTKDCMTALITGCLPYSKRGNEIAFSQSIGSAFKQRGYQTVSVASCRLDMAGIQDYLEANMDKVFDPISEGYKATNAEGSNDHILFPHFERWMKEEKKNTIPFYAQLYLFNTHWPYVCDNCTIKDDRMFESFKSVDDYIRKLFGLLEETGHLKDTIIVFTGDHGEYKKKYYRLHDLSSQILKPLTAIYAPRAVIPPGNFLKINTDRVVSTLDLYPTLRTLLHNGYNKNSSNFTGYVSQDKLYCITGLDLIGTPIPTDRVAISYNYVSRGGKPNFLVLSNHTSGLFKKNKKLVIIDYTSDCTTDWKSGPCKSALTPKDKKYWRKFLTQHIHQHPFMASKAITAVKKMLR